MRILYVGDSGYKHRGARYYFYNQKLSNGFIRNGHNVYFFSDTDTSRMGNIFRSSRLGGRYCNRAFIQTCYNFQPALIVFVNAEIIFTESVREIKSILPQVKMVQISFDPLFARHNLKILKSKLSLLDATFITTAGTILKRISHPRGRASYIPNPIDSSIEYPECHEHSDQEHDVFWAFRGFEAPTHENPRLDLPLFLEKSGKVNIDYHGMNGKPELMNADYFKAIENARMGLNLTRTHLGSDNLNKETSPEELYLYSSDRISHYMGSGLLTFSTRENKLEELFEEDKEMVFFSSKEELLEKVIYYKNNDDERREIAKRGWEKSHNCFNERLVAKYMLEVAFRLPLSEDYAWPTETY